MELLERVWDATGNVAAGIGSPVDRLLTGLFGSSNARTIRKLEPKIEAINLLEPRYQAMSDAELAGQTAEFKRRLAAGDAFAAFQAASLASADTARNPGGHPPADRPLGGLCPGGTNGRL